MEGLNKIGRAPRRLGVATNFIVNSPEISSYVTNFIAKILPQSHREDFAEPKLSFISDRAFPNERCEPLFLSSCFSVAMEFEHFPSLFSHCYFISRIQSWNNSRLYAANMRLHDTHQLREFANYYFHVWRVLNGQTVSRERVVFNLGSASGLRLKGKQDTNLIVQISRRCRCNIPEGKLRRDWLIYRLTGDVVLKGLKRRLEFARQGTTESHCWDRVCFHIHTHTHTQ